MYALVFIGVTAFLLSLLSTPLVRDCFRAWGVLDRPDTGRKAHASPIPRVGGVAILLTYAASFGILLTFQFNAGTIVERGFPLTLRLLPAAVLVFITGLLDDIVGLTPKEKMLGQLFASGSVYFAGVHLSHLAGYTLAPWLSFPITVLWLLACTNAVNLIDGVDGLAAGVGLFATGTILLAALLENNIPLALATAPLVGALLGFLRYNFNPATIFLGDSGSLLIGFLLGCFGLLWTQKSAAILGVTAPLMALSIPLLDTTLAIFRRFLRQKPIFGADRGHIHHRLLDRGFSPRQVALILYGFCAIGAACSVAMTNRNFHGIVIVIFCAVACIGLQQLGYIEFGVAGRMFVEGAFRRHLTSQIALQGFEGRLNAASTPENCWDIIRDSSHEFGFHHIELALCGDTYRHRNGAADARCWNVRIPLPEDNYIELSRVFGESAQTGAVAPFADIVRRSLGPKVAAFESNLPRSRAASSSV